MHLEPGDHICAIYTSHRELADIVGDFLAEGLHRGERCWYLPADDEAAAIWRALEDRGLSVAHETNRGALMVSSPSNVYAVRGDFDPEQTMRVFSAAIEQALTDGFNGFRAAANMSWALALGNAIERVITYEALLRSLFSSARATGLCLYDRLRMPLAVIDGALSTHPTVRMGGRYAVNAFYDSTVDALPTVDAAAVAAKLMHLERASIPDERPTRSDRRR